MRWSKIKNIMILLLAIVNVCLLAMVGVREADSRRLDRETRERMVQVLSDSGVDYLPEDLPGTLPLTGWELETAERGRGLAETLVGPVTQITHTGPGSGYLGLRGNVVFRSGGVLEVSYFEGSCVLDGTDASAYGLELLESLGIEAREMLSRPVENGLEVTYAQLWSGGVIPEMTVTARFIRGELRELRGRLLFADGTEEESQTGLDGATALARFLEERSREGYVCSQVRQMYPGYLFSRGPRSSLQPAWFLETDTWPWRFAVDGRTGEVTTLP